MSNYKSPGVYVEEIPSAVQAIAGVGTSTAGFIGMVADDTVMTPRPNPRYNSSISEESSFEIDPTVDDPVGMALAQALELTEEIILVAGTQLNQSQAQALKARIGTIKVTYRQKPSEELKGKKLAEDIVHPTTGAPLFIEVGDPKTKIDLIKGHEIKQGEVELIRNTLNAEGIKINEIAVLQTVNLATIDKSYLVDKTLVDAVNVEAKTPLPVNTIIKDETSVQHVLKAMSIAGLTKLKVKNSAYLKPQFKLVDAGDMKLCTNFSEFKKYFGDFSTDPQHNYLAHAVFGFFLNGGTRCYVVRIKNEQELSGALEKFAAIDEIALVAAPGVTSDTVRSAIVAHCKIATQDRFAIFDSPEQVEDANGNPDLIALGPANPKQYLPPNSDYAAFYFPWLQVFDSATKTTNPKGEGRIFVPPSGHMAGIYARVDANRGVHKAPANEPVMGALGLKYKLSKAQQDGLNPHGVNCIRELNGAIRVWGARTIGGDANGEWRYLSVRRTLLYLRESIDEGTQWAVFEPNDQNLWAKITRNVSAFLTTVWRAGALFGSTPAEAFYVKCDAETNPPELREVGQIVTEIGVAIVRPAEFVIFRISQWQPQTAA